MDDFTVNQDVINMTPLQMATDAREALKANTNMTLTRSRGSKLPIGFPRGEFLCENYNGTNSYSYKPQRILDWLSANGLLGEQL